MYMHLNYAYIIELYASKFTAGCHGITYSHPNLSIISILAGAVLWMQLSVL